MGERAMRGREARGILRYQVQDVRPLMLGLSHCDAEARLRSDVRDVRRNGQEYMLVKYHKSIASLNHPGSLHRERRRELMFRASAPARASDQTTHRPAVSSAKPKNMPR